jgi:hypothetical protein
MNQVYGTECITVYCVSCVTYFHARIKVVVSVLLTETFKFKCNILVEHMKKCYQRTASLGKSVFQLCSVQPLTVHSLVYL